MRADDNPNAIDSAGNRGTIVPAKPAALAATPEPVEGPRPLDALIEAGRIWAITELSTERGYIGHLTTDRFVEKLTDFLRLNAATSPATEGDAGTAEGGLPAEPPEPCTSCDESHDIDWHDHHWHSWANDATTYIGPAHAAKPAATASIGLEELRALSEVADRAERLFDVANRDVADPYGYLTADLGKALAELAYVRRALTADGGRE